MCSLVREQTFILLATPTFLSLARPIDSSHKQAKTSQANTHPATYVFLVFQKTRFRVVNKFMQVEEISQRLWNHIGIFQHFCTFTFWLIEAKKKKYVSTLNHDTSDESHKKPLLTLEFWNNILWALILNFPFKRIWNMRRRGRKSNRREISPPVI